MFGLRTAVALVSVTIASAGAVPTAHAGKKTKATAPTTTTAVLEPVTLTAPATTETWLAPTTTTTVATTTTTTTTTAPAPTGTTGTTAPATTTSTTTTGTTAAPAPAPTAPARPFAADSFWNAPLASDAPLDAKSSTYVADIQRQMLTYLPWINTTQYSEPVYTVDKDQPLVKVTLDKTSTDAQTTALRNALAAGVPIPAGAKPAAGTDKNLVIYQPSTDTMWEFWLAADKTDGWHASWGGKMTGVSTNPGHFTLPNNRWGAAATSLPLLGGLMRISELQSGRIDHALALSLPEVRKDVYSWPAQRTDGQIDSVDAVPEGTRFRLPASLDLSKIAMAPMVRQMAIAAQRYGIVIRDRSGSIAFYGEDPTPTGTDPYSGLTGLFGGKYPSTLLAGFPWSKLQALKTQTAVDPY